MQRTTGHALRTVRRLLCTAGGTGRGPAIPGARFVGDPKRTQGLERVAQPGWKGVKLEGSATYPADPDSTYPVECDALVIGGGAIGCSAAYWLTKHMSCKVVVLERDPSYTRASSPLSCGGIRQQFSEPENIQMSLFGAQFLRNIKENLAVFDLDPPDICYAPHGYLVLANEANAEILQANNVVQRKLGAKVDLMTPAKIQATWPWLNVSDIALGSYGTENEGWFDPYLFLQALKRKAVSQNVQFVVGELLDFEFSMQSFSRKDSTDWDQKRLKAALIKCPDNLVRSINFAVVVNAAGPWAGHVAHLAGVGDFAGATQLPVEPRRQSVFVVSLPPNAAKKQQQQQSPATRVPGIDAPFVHDVGSGLYLRRDGFQGDFVTYVNPPPRSVAAMDEPECNGVDLEPDYDWFDKEVWPRLAHRVPCMEAVKVRNAWAGFYDYNAFDQNLVIGRHPYHDNLVFCNGSSGHGIQHAIAIGRAVSELVLFKHYKTIDLSRMGFDRLEAQQPIRETGII